MSDEKIIAGMEIDGHVVTMKFNVDGDAHNKVVVSIRSDKPEFESAFMDMIDRLGDLMHRTAQEAQQVVEERA